MPQHLSQRGRPPAAERFLQMLRRGEGYVLPPGPRYDLHPKGQPLRRRAPRTTAAGQPVRL